MNAGSDEARPTGGSARFGAARLPLDGPRSIVVAVDDPSSSFHAVSYAAGLARRNATELTLVHVCKVPTTLAWLAEASAPIEATDLEDRGATIMKELADLALTECGIEVRCALCIGVATREIARVANELHADAVIVGCSQSLFHRFVGSIAAQLVRQGSWPVTVVP